jgi:hypothetical protein
LGKNSETFYRKDGGEEILTFGERISGDDDVVQMLSSVCSRVLCEPQLRVQQHPSRVALTAVVCTLLERWRLRGALRRFFRCLLITRTPLVKKKRRFSLV